MAIVLDGTSGLTTNSGTVISASTIGVGGTTPSTSGSGITFPATQSASTNANTLDDYEEGTWTPALLNGGVTFSSIASATYTKVGRMVYVQLDVNVSSNSNAGAFIITGQPFALSGTLYSALSIGYNQNGTTAILVFGSQGFEFYPSNSATSISNSQMSNARLIISGCYQTNT